VKTGKELRRFAWPGGRVWDVALSRDGTRAAAGGDANFASIWDATTGRELHRLTGHAEAVVRVAFSPDGRRLLTGSWDRRVRLWDAATGEVLRTFEGHTALTRLREVTTGEGLAVGFDPDAPPDARRSALEKLRGRLLAAAGSSD
jgi:WD40 repeat protein